MGSASTGVLRLARAWVAVTLTLGLAGLGHSVAGGPISASALAVLTVLLVPLALAATRLRWTAGRAVVGLGAGQVLVHALLTAMAPAAQGYAAPAHLTHGTGLTSLSADPSATHGAAGMGLSVSMVAAHVIATLLTAVLVGYAEEALWAVLVRLLPPTRTPAHLPVAARIPMVSRTPERLHGIPVGAVAGRGPPAASLPA